MDGTLRLRCSNQYRSDAAGLPVLSAATFFAFFVDAAGFLLKFILHTQGHTLQIPLR
jgi:hypothetical protein